MKTKLFLMGAALAMGAMSCNNGSEVDTAAVTDSTNMQPAPPPAPVTVSPSGASQDFPDAALSIMGVKATDAGSDSVKLAFTFGVKNYTLGMQTPDTASKECNNSAQGQHIHFIMDNQPYKALYKPENEASVVKSSEHYLMCFLSRSYHESIKHKSAYALYHFEVDNKGNLKKLDNPTTPMIFYSRPKGDYLGKDTKNVLLDFYLVNTDLKDGNKVEVEIHTAAGKDTAMMLTSWEPQFIRNLPMGTNKVTLHLINANGDRMQGPQTEVSREFKLAEKEPM